MNIKASEVYKFAKIVFGKTKLRHLWLELPLRIPEVLGSNRTRILAIMTKDIA